MPVHSQSLTKRVPFFRKEVAGLELLPAFLNFPNKRGRGSVTYFPNGKTNVKRESPVHLLPPPPPPAPSPSWDKWLSRLGVQSLPRMRGRMSNQAVEPLGPAPYCSLCCPRPGCAFLRRISGWKPVWEVGFVNTRTRFRTHILLGKKDL